MRYVKHFLTDIAGIEVYPMISLLIFFSFFVCLSIYVFKLRKSHAQYMAGCMLDGEQGMPSSNDPQ